VRAGIGGPTRGWRLGLAAVHVSYCPCVNKKHTWTERDGLRLGRASPSDPLVFSSSLYAPDHDPEAELEQEIRDEA
jgi:hypothetical protein